MSDSGSFSHSQVLDEAISQLRDGQSSVFATLMQSCKPNHPWSAVWNAFTKSAPLEPFVEQVTPHWDPVDRHLLVPLLTCLAEQSCWTRRYSYAEKLAKRAMVRSNELSIKAGKSAREIEYMKVLSHLALTRVYAYQRRFDLAHRLLQYLQSEHGTFQTDIAFTRSEVLRAQGELQLASQQLTLAQIDNSGDNPYFEARRAWLLIEAGKFEEARTSLDRLKDFQNVRRVNAVREVLERIVLLRQDLPCPPMQVDWESLKLSAYMGDFKRLTLLCEIALAQGQNREVMELVHGLVRPPANAKWNGSLTHSRPSPWVPHRNGEGLDWLQPYFGLPLPAAYWAQWPDFSWGSAPAGFFPWPVTSIDSQEESVQNFILLMGFGARAFRALGNPDGARQVANFAKTVRSTQGKASLVKLQNPDLAGASSVRVELVAAGRIPKWVAVESASGAVDYAHAQECSRDMGVFFVDRADEFLGNFFGQKLPAETVAFQVLAKKPSTAALDSFHFCIWVGFTQGPPVCLPVAVPRAD